MVAFTRCSSSFSELTQHTVQTSISMKGFSRLISFNAQDDEGQRYFADLGSDQTEVPTIGASLLGYRSFSDFLSETGGAHVKFGKVCPSRSTITPLS